MSWYSRELDKGFAGMIANTAIRNCDSYAVEEEKGLNPGDAVVLGTTENLVKKVDSGSESKVIGVVVHNHKEPSNFLIYVGLMLYMQMFLKHKDKCEY